MLELDKIDIDNIEEMYNRDIIHKLDMDNVNKIYSYLINKGIYYAKDMFIENLELFLLDSDVFIERFNDIIDNIGSNYVDVIGEDSSILENMYK